MITLRNDLVVTPFRMVNRENGSTDGVACLGNGGCMRIGHQASYICIYTTAPQTAHRRSSAAEEYNIDVLRYIRPLVSYLFKPVSK